MNFYMITFFIGFSILGIVAGKAADTDYSEDEITALEELRKEVEDELDEDFMRKDEYLIPFLRAKVLNVPKAAALVKTTMKWWRETEMSSVLDESYPSFEKNYAYNLDISDKDGRPVIFMFFGRWNLRNVIISGQKAQMLRYFDQMMERAVSKIREIRETGEDVNRFNIVADMNGYSFTTHGCLNCIPLILDFAKHLETYYAARAIRIITINTPRLFIPVFELIKPILSETTAKGFKIIGPNKDEWKSELLKVIPKSELPVEYGGTGKKKSKAKTTTTVRTTTTTTASTTTTSTERPRPKTTKKPIRPQKQKPPPPKETNVIPNDEYDCEYDE